MLHAFGKLEITRAGRAAARSGGLQRCGNYSRFISRTGPHGVFRKNLLDTLFSTLPEEKALSNLNTCNYYLRQFLKETRN